MLLLHGEIGAIQRSLQFSGGTVIRSMIFDTHLVAVKDFIGTKLTLFGKVGPLAITGKR